MKYAKIYTMQKKIYLSGTAGSGKTEYIKGILQKISGKKLFVTFASSNKNIDDSKGVSFEWIIQRIFSDNGYEKKVLSDFLGIDIILNITKDVFKQNPTLFALTKSSRFASELYILFGALKNNLLTPDDFKSAVLHSDISDIDRNRLLLVNDVYEKYNNFLAENDMLDYRDAAGIALKQQKLPKYDFIAVDGIQDMSYAQLELIKQISTNILLCGDDYAKIRLTSGVNTNLDGFETQYLEKNHRSIDILSQAMFLFDKKNSPVENRVSCLVFEDIYDELSYITKEIKNKVNSGKGAFKDYAILVRDGSFKQKILDFLKAEEVPAGIEIFDENFNNFKIKLTRYLSLCMVFEKLNLDSFSKNDFDSIGVMPRSDREIIFEELDLYIENILYDTIENGYTIDRLISIKEEHNKPSLLNVVYENIQTFAEKDSKSLAMELGAISKIYELYKEQRFTDIIFFCASKESETVDRNSAGIKMLAGKIKDLEYLYKNLLKTVPSISALMDVISQPVERELKNNDFVHVLPFFKTKGMTFKNVYIPSMTEKSMPAADRFTQFISQQANDEVSKFLQNRNPCFGKIIPDEKTVMKEETSLLYLGMTRAEDKLTISTHKYEDKKLVQPSVFFNRLSSLNPGSTREIQIEKEELERELAKSSEIEENDTTKVISDEDILKLNASAIRNFQKCPRKYYFANLLNLKDKKTFSASYGTAVHTVMQIFFEKYLKQFNKDTLLSIAEAYFNCALKPEAALNAGFSEKDIETLLTSDALSIEEMHDNFISAVEELEKYGFFNDIPDSAIAEIEFRFKTEKIPDTEFDGRIDIITEKDEKFSLFDYKTGMQNKEMLTYYVSENGVSFKSKNGRGNPENLKKEYPYQVPLYYIASLYAKNLENVKGKLQTLGLKYIRPSIDGGYVDDMVSADTLEEFSDRILTNLKTEVADKIRETVTFKSEKDNFTCKNCPYEFLCDGGADD